MLSGFTAGSTVIAAPVVVAAPVLESISSDIGIAAGGTKQTLRGYGLTGTTGVTWGGASATSVVVVSDNVVTCVTPSGTASETAVDVVITNSAGSSTLSAAFEYGAVTANTFASETFVSGFGALSSDATIGAVPWARGTATKAVYCTGTNASGEVSVQLSLPNNQLTTTNGVFIRCFYAVDSATMALVTASGQIKMFLCRVNNNADETGMGIIGAQSPGGGNTLCLALDVGIAPVLGSFSNAQLGDNQWVEDLYQITRNTGASTGRIRRWVNGKLVMNVTSANIGDNTGGVSVPRSGLVFTQGVGVGTMSIWLADYQASDGYLEPLES